MKPRIICHMVGSVDGRTDGDSLEAVMDRAEYEATADTFGAEAWICGRTTMQEHFAEAEPFVSATSQPAGSQTVFVACQAESYAVAVDTVGKLRWADGDLDGDHLICIVSERAPADYLTALRDKAISYIVVGQDTVDLPKAMELLGEHFGIRTLLLEGGGHINGGFLQAGLVDEVSLLLVPGIDGRHGVAAVFDGMNPPERSAVPLKLLAVERRPNDILWLRYEVVRA